MIFEIALRSLIVAGTATLFAAPFGLALGLLLARRDFVGKSLVQTLITLPLVLPPVAVGLLLLQLLSPRAPWAAWVHAMLFGNPLFTWRAAVLAAFIMGMPLLVRTAEAAIAAVPREAELAGISLGAGRLRTAFTVTLPLASRGILYGLLLCFLRGLSEFGATVLIAGNIPGETETLSLAIYARATTFRDDEALTLCLISLCIAFATTVFAESWVRARRRRSEGLG